jgi:hypothetical protein
MKLCVALMTALFLCCSAQGIAEKPKPPEPRWKIDLLQRYEFQAFDRTINYRWMLHQGVLFVSPEKILVYQVNRSRAPAKLAVRDASGGSGNFLLDIRVVSTRDGSDVKSLELPTSAEFSKVLATRDGRFIVCTGEILYLYSADFVRLASRALPLKRLVQEESWQVDVSPSGEEVMLVHQQIFKRDAISPTSDVTSAQTDVEVLDASTLQSTKSFTLPSSLLMWHAADHMLLSGQPLPAQGPFSYGLLDFEGKWSPLSSLEWYQEKQSCGYGVEPLDRQRFAAYGCGRISVLSGAGETLFSLNIGSKEFVGSVQGAGDYLAIQYERRSTQKRTSAYVPVLVAQPLRLDLYQFRSNQQQLSLPLRGSNVYYAVSPGGTVAVVDGTLLELFVPQH